MTPVLLLFADFLAIKSENDQPLTQLYNLIPEVGSDDPWPHCLDCRLPLNPLRGSTLNPLTPQFHGIVLHTDLLTFLLTYFSKIMSFKNISPHGEIFLI